MILLCIGISIHKSFEDDLKPGPLALENYFLYSDMINKPWSKLSSFSLGVLFAFLYMEILAYR